MKHLKIFREAFNEDPLDEYKKILKDFCDDLQDEGFDPHITEYEIEGEDGEDNGEEHDLEIEIDLGDQISYDTLGNFNKTIQLIEKKSLIMKLLAELLLRINNDNTFTIEQIEETDIDTILIKLKINR